MDGYGKGNKNNKKSSMPTETSSNSSSSSTSGPSSNVPKTVLPSQIASQSMSNLLLQLTSMNAPPRRGGGRKKRKLAELDPAQKQELEDLREWKRRCEEKEQQFNSLITSSCIVCLYVRPDLISYGACGHMVCVNCTLEHISRRLMVMRRRSQNTGCKARLS